VADVVLDSSAVLALLRNEPGADLVERVIAGSIISAVNLTEIVTKLIERGAPAKDAIMIARGLPFAIAGHDEDLATSAGALWAQTRDLGLSLGDRACLALAARENLPALTADRRWTEVEAEVGVRVQLIR
jgi:PIN domain nuclease of toxin-antitoxin system